MKEMLKAAVVQAGPVLFDTSATLARPGPVRLGPVRPGELTREAAGQGEGAILFAAISRGSIPRGEYDPAAVGYSARADAFALSVNRNARSVLSFNNGSPLGGPASAPEGMPDVRVDGT